MEFQPSSYSGDYGVATSLISAAISAVGGIASQGISAANARKLAEAQGKHGEAMSEKELKLAMLQKEASDAAIHSQNYTASVMGRVAEKKLLYIAGTVILLGSMAALTVVLVKRS